MKELIKRLLGPEVKIYHIASMARSGETLIQRTLASHPRIHIVCQLYEKDTEENIRLFKFLQKYPKDSLRVRNKHLIHLNCSQNDVLVLKQGIWEHKSPFLGFLLSRNPVSIFSSLLTYDSKTPNKRSGSWEENEKRLIRWMKSIDRGLSIKLQGLSPVEQFCLFYNRRMGALFDLNLPIVFYENFVSNPKKEIMNILKILNLEYSDSLLEAHKLFNYENIGHGKNALSRSIDKSSLYKFQDILSVDEFEKILEETYDVAVQKFGYRMQWDKIDIG